MTLACLFLTLAQGVAMTHVTVVDVERGRLLADRTVLISGRHIVKIDSGVVERRPSDTRVIDGTGRFLIPGLWDMHVHLAGDTAAAARMLGWGITGARDMGGGLDAILALRAGIRAGRLRGPRLFVAGPALRGPRSTSDTGFGVIRTGAEAHRVVDSLAGRGVDFIKVHEDLSPVAWFAIARAARGRHLSLAGHVPASLSPEVVADSGDRSIEHLEFIPDRCLALFDSTARAAAATPPGCSQSDVRRLLEHLHADSVWLDPTIGSFRGWAPRQWPSIEGGFRDLTPTIIAVGLPVLAGTDYGDPRFVAGEGLHDEIALLAQSGFGPLDALRAATSNPARFQGLSDSLGIVKPGAVADLVLLEGNPLADIGNTRRIAAVIQGGTFISRSELDSLQSAR